MQVIDRIPMAVSTEASGESFPWEPRAHLYGTILDHITDAVAIIDPSGLYLEQNPAHASLLGYSDDELRGQTPALHLGQEAAGEIMAELRAVGAYRGEVESRTKEGEPKILELSAFAVRDSRGTPLCYVGIKRDMTGRRRIEEALVGVRGALEQERQEKEFREAARAALEESEQRQRFMLEQIPAILWATDLQLRFTLSTGNGLKQLGLQPDQVVGTPLTAYFQTEDPEALPIVYVRRALAGEPVRFQQDWKGMTFETVVEPLYGTDGGIVGAIGFSQDITEQRRVQAALVASEERLVLAAEGSSIALWDGRCLPGKHWSDPDNPIWWSPKIREMLTLESGEPFDTLGLWASRVHQDDLGFVMAALTAHAERRMPFDVEYRLRTNRGDYRWIRGRGQAMWDELGRPYRMAGSCLDLTERKQAEEALRESEAQFRMMFDNAGIGMCRVDMAGRFLRTNRAFCELVGYSQEELATLCFKDLTFPDDLDYNLALFEQVKAGKISRYSLDNRYCRKDGQLVWASLVGSVGYDREGRPAYVLAQVQDITERKQAEVALRRSQDKLNQALQASNTGLWEWNIRTGEVSYSKEWKRQLGYEEAEVADRFETWESFLHPDDRQRATDYVRTYLANPASSYRQEFRLRHKDGSYRWIAACASFVVEADGHKIRLLGSHTDITERKRAEDALRESEERYRQLADLSPIGMYVYCEGRTAYVNQAACRIMGVSLPDELLRRPTMDFVHPDSREAVIDSARCLLEGGEPVRRAERKYIKLDGQVIDVEVQAGPIMWNGKPAIQGIFSDVTERMASERVRREHHVLLSAIMDAALDVIYVKDLNGRYIHLNRAGLQLMGMPIEAVVGRTDHDLHPAELAQQCAASDRRVLSTGESVTVEESAEIFGGRKVYLTIKAPYRDADGTILGVIGASRDITARKETEQALRASEELFSKAFRSSPYPIVISELVTGLCLDANDAALALFGYRREEVTGRTARELRLWPAESVREQFVDYVKREGSIRNIEISLRRKDGAWRRVLVSAEIIELRGTSCMVTIGHDVTEQKRAEDALRVSEERYARATAVARVGVWELDYRSSAYHGDANLHALLGYGTGELGTDPFAWLGMVHPDDRDRALAAHESVFTGGADSYEVELRMLHRSGAAVWTLVRGSIQRDELGRPVRCTGATVDITEKKHAEEALRASEERFRSLIKNSSDIINLLDADGTIRYRSPAGARVFGWSDEEMQGRSVFEFIHPDDVSRTREFFLAHVRTPGVTDPHVFRFRKPDGSYAHIEAVGNNLLDDPNVQGIVVNSRDVTERVRAEEELQRSHAFMRQIIDADPNLIFAKDREGRFTLVNQAMADCYGTTIENLVGKTDAEFNRHADEVTFFRQVDLEVMNTLTDRFIPEERITDATGTSRWLQTVKRPIMDDEGRVELVLGVATDISQRKQDEAMLLEVAEGVSTVTGEAFFHSLVKHLSKALQVDYVLVTRPVAPGLPRVRTIAAYGNGRVLDNFEYDVPGTPCGAVFETGRSYLVSSGVQQAYPAFTLFGRLDIEGYLGVPMIGTGGEIKGMVGLLRQAPLAQSGRAESLVRIFVSRAVAELERQDAESALRRSEARYRTLVESIRDVVYLLSPQGSILSLNPAFETNTGWLREEWLGKSFLDFVHPSDRADGVAGLERALAGEKDTRTELRIRTKHGDWIIVEAAGGPYEEQGQVCGVLGVARDITARVKAERALSKTQADLRRITDAIPGFVYQYRVGPDGAQSFPFASRGTKELLGYEPAELEADARIGWSSVLQEDVSALQASIQVSAAELTPWSQEFRVRAADGQSKWLRGSSLPERQEDGATVWYGLFTDVTARREAEQQLRLTQFAMDHAADAIIWAGPDRRLVYANEEACRSLGYSKREMLQLSISDITPQHDPVRFEQRLALLRQGQTDQYQSIHRAKDGREFPVEVSIRYLEHQGVGYVCGIARDITERKQFEQQLRHADRLATLGTITAGVAHELNNPLFVISGHLHLIERKLVRRQLKALRKELMAAQDAAERATKIVSRFLNTAHGSVDVREPCDVAEIIEQALVLMRNEFRARQIQLQRQIDPSMPSVSADSQALTQVFLNLLTNACQALESAAGAGLISIELRTTDLQGSAWVECLLRDNGPGIPPDLLPRVFDPFFTTKPIGEGTGLGLAICHRIISELCGTLTCESRLGEGATFRMRLPATGSSAPLQSLRRSTRGRKG